MGQKTKTDKKRVGFIYSLAQMKWLHRLLARLKIYVFVDSWLKKHPILRKKGCITYRLTSLSSVPLAEEIFSDNGCYLQAIQGKPLNFVDLGCNTGWFPLLLKKMYPKEKFTGLCIDGDPNMTKETLWHLTENKMSGCKVLTGIVGAENGDPQKFFINPSSTQSSLKPLQENHPFPPKGDIISIVVPSLNLKSEWEKTNREATIDLLKVDIEGSELDFLKKEISFLRSKVKKMVIEWHQWHVSLEEIKGFLSQNNFYLVEIVEVDDNGGVAIFRNTQNL